MYILAPLPLQCIVTNLVEISSAQIIRKAQFNLRFMSFDYKLIKIIKKKAFRKWAKFGLLVGFCKRYFFLYRNFCTFRICISLNIFKLSNLWLNNLFTVKLTSRTPDRTPVNASKAVYSHWVIHSWFLMTLRLRNFASLLEICFWIQIM